MHFFELAGPDLLLGFDADPAIRNVVGIIAANPQLALKAVGLRRFGQQIIERLGGKRVHPNFAVPGGVNAPLSGADRDAIAAELDAQVGVAIEGLALLAGWVENNQDLALSFASFPSNYMGMVDAEGGLAALRRQDPDLRPRRQTTRAVPRREDYLAIVAEHVESWSFLKFPYYRKQGWPAGRLPRGPAGAAERGRQDRHALWRRRSSSVSGPRQRPAGGGLALLSLRAADRADLRPRAHRAAARGAGYPFHGHPHLRPGETQSGRASASSRRRAGTLFHDYRVDANGLLTRANLIVATGHNNWAMNQAVESVAKAFVHGPEVPEGMLNRVEAAVRCYDPCFSCSTHAVGKMPLEVTIVDADGRLLARVTK